MEVIQFASSEKEFIHNFGPNRGYTESYSKINRCYFLSSDAKQLYYNIRDYAYHGRDCFPGTETLRAELGWSKEKLSKYLKELIDKGFITVSRRFGKPSVYTIQELHTIPVLVHSEIVHEIRLRYNNSSEFFEALAKYKQSELCEKVMKAGNPLDYTSEINEWFDKEISSAHAEGVTDHLPVKEKVLSVQLANPELPKTFSISGVQSEKDPDRNEKRKKAKSHKDVPVEEWNSRHFVSYFGELYFKKFGQPYMPTAADYGCMKRVIESGKSKEVIKKHIENFMELDYFNVKTVRVFSSTHSQTVLDQYVNNGAVPSYKKVGGTSMARPNKNELSDWANEVDNLFS